MKKFRIVFALLAAILTTASATSAVPNAAKGNYSIDPHGITLRLTDRESSADYPTAMVRLQAFAPDVIRVTATADSVFAPDASLVVLSPSDFTAFDVSENDTAVCLATSKIIASVNLYNGNVTFRDSSGRIIAAEAPDGRSLAPIEVEGTRAWTVGQKFLSLDDNEGLYGLGQHQSDEFNLKGRNEELFQYNTKVSVPFVMSTGGYGILWDSYSLCRFGNPEPYRQLGEVFRLIDKDNREGALTGTYRPKDGSDPLVRREDSIYFEHLIRGDLDHVVNLPRDFNFNGSEVAYEGTLIPDRSGLFSFILYYSGYMRVEIDGKEVVATRWRTAWNPNAYKFDVELEKDRPVSIKIDWEPNGDVAYCGLRVYEPVDPAARRQMSWWGEMQDAIDYYFVYGDRPDEVVSAYRSLTGKAPIMAKWVLGYWQSREKYNTSDEMLSTLGEFRRRHIPIDNIVLDWLHWKQDSWGSHEFDPVRFPDPKGMVDSIHALNGRVMVSVWPKFYVTTDHFKEFDSRGWMYPLPVNDSIRDWVGPGYLGSFYDAYNPEARRLFWHQMEEHYAPLGFDAWWMDASEPNIRDCTDIQYRKDLITPTALGPSTKYFNAYGLMNAEAIYNGQRTMDPDRRVFLLTRSGFAGQQRYSTATWSGDIATRWEDLKAQISAGLNFAASGIPWWSMDIGGFCVEDRYVEAATLFNETGVENDDLKEWRELNTRWYQFGTFVPIFRAHGQWPFREIFNIAPEDHPAYASILYYTRLRYDLMPYLYSLAGMTHFDDYTIMRPLAMDFPDDIAIRDTGDQYMFGPALMVAPVHAYGARERSVRFPDAPAWYDFYSGHVYEGNGTLQVDAPYDRIPLFVRAGSIIPFGPEIEWSDQRPADVIDLYVYAGADGSFTLYEDENVNYNYEKGLFATIPFTWDDNAGVLTIGSRTGDFPGMLRERVFNIIKVSPDAPAGYRRGAEGHTVRYTGESLSIQL